MPFRAENFTGLLFQIATENPIDIAERTPGIDPEVAQMVRTAMARDREDRYADCATFAAHIEGWLQRAGISLASLGISVDNTMQHPIIADGMTNADPSLTGQQTASPLARSTATPTPTQAGGSRMLMPIAVVAALLGVATLLFVVFNRGQQSVDDPTVQPAAANNPPETSEPANETKAESPEKSTEETAPETTRSEETTGTETATPEETAPDSAAPSASASSSVPAPQPRVVRPRPVPTAQPKTAPQPTSTSTGRKHTRDL